MRQIWTDYFRHNAATLLAIDWDDPYCITPEERRRITTSVQQFQLGESSEGRHVIALAEQYVARSGDTEYLAALRLFIGEEQRHSRYLARFMELQRIPLSHKDAVDSVFRLLRRVFNLELALLAMLTAEIIAVPYYRSLYAATNSPVLRAICRQILRDEVRHLQFQVETLAKLRMGRNPLYIWSMKAAHCVLLTATTFIVWAQHHPVLAAGGYSLATFWRANWTQYARLFRQRARISAPSPQ